MIEQLDRLGLYLNQPEPAILCIQCKFALKADGDRVSRHLGERHGISKLARRGLGPFIRTLCLPDPKTLPMRSDGASPHPHLRIQQGAACRHCGLRSTSLEVLSRHLKEVHPQDIQHSRGRGFPESHWLQDHILDRLRFQAWTVSNIGRSWTVHLYRGQPQGPHTPVTIYQAPEAIQVFAKELFVREQQYLSQQARGSLPQPTGRTTSATDPALITNWMRRTGWEETFRNTRRDLIVAMAQCPPKENSGPLWLANYKDEALISSQEDEHKLTRMMAALDRLFERSNDTIKHTDISLRRWLRGIYPDQPYKRPFELVVKPSTERRYRQLLKNRNLHIMKRPFESTQTDYVALTGASETTPWLQHTRWAELFRDRPLGIIASTAKQPASQWSRNYLLGQWQGFPMWSSAETEAQLQMILHGLDLMFDRARATLDRTPYISRCWLNTFAKDAFWPHGFRVIPSFKRYLAIWKRFICFVFRVLQYPSWQRKEVYNLRLGSNEIKMMQHVLYLAGQLQLGEDGHVSDSSDSEDDESCCQDCHYDWEIPPDSENTDIDQDIDTSIDDAEEVGEKQIPGSEESDFHLPNGYWLQLSEALFQLSMMFWTHQDPAGNMSSSAIIYYTAVMGIQQRSLTFDSAYNSTSELAGLMWIGRLLFLEYALPVYSYATLAYEWPCRDHYPSQPDRLDAIRKKYLIRGCYTHLGKSSSSKHLPSQLSREKVSPEISPGIQTGSALMPRLLFELSEEAAYLALTKCRS
ncbi:hypothetical protein FOFC_07757 [Fusarium oxysporum]|nr:hypothetical protein FOFC_07757 [Fusarium oxysporum]